MPRPQLPLFGKRAPIGPEIRAIPDSEPLIACKKWLWLIYCTGEPSEDQAQAALRRMRAATRRLRLRRAAPRPLPDADRHRPARPRAFQADQHRPPLRADGGGDARAARRDARAGVRPRPARRGRNRMGPGLSPEGGAGTAAGGGETPGLRAARRQLGPVRAYESAPAGRGRSALRRAAARAAVLLDRADST